MYFNAIISVVIGDKILQTVSSVAVSNDGQHIGADCDLQVPLNCRIQYRDGRHDFLTDYPKNLFKTGDPITVRAKYEGMEWQTVFEGFVYDFIEGNPIVIKCVDYVYLLNQKSIDVSYASITLKALLNKIVEGTGITLAQPIMELTLEKITFRLMSPAAILEWLKKEIGLQISLSGKQLYVNVASNTTTVVKYNTSRNVINSDLQKPSAAYQKFKVKAWFIRQDGTRDSFEVGDTNGTLREVFFYKIPRDQVLYKRLAEEALVKYRQYKYGGTIETYLYPQPELFGKAEYVDIRYPARTANYVIIGIVFNADVNGYHYKLKLAFLSDLI